MKRGLLFWSSSPQAVEMHGASLLRNVESLQMHSKSVAGHSVFEMEVNAQVVYVVGC